MPEYDNLPTPAARSLARYLSDLSEEYAAAGWLVDWEYMAWRWMHGLPDDSPMFTDLECADLAWLADQAGGWVRWGRDGLGFVPLKTWLAHLESPDV